MTMPPENEGGGAPGLMSQRIFGVPTIVWVAGIALIAFWYLSRHGSVAGAGSPTTSGGGGDIQTGTTRVAKDAVRITIVQNPQPSHEPPEREGGHHHHPPPHHRKPPPGGGDGGKPGEGRPPTNQGGGSGPPRRRPPNPPVKGKPPRSKKHWREPPKKKTTG